MSQTGTDQFVCEGCGRSYRWKPEFAGRKVKCKCGQVMTAPEVMSSPEPEVEEDELYALAGETRQKKARQKHHHLPEGTDHCPACNAFLVIGAKICVQCGYDLVTGKAPPKPTAPVDDGTTALKEDAPPAAKPTKAPAPTKAAPVKPTGPKLAYQPAPVKHEIESVLDGSPGKDFWAPIALIILGTIVEYAVLMWGQSNVALGLLATSIYVGATMFFNVVVMLIGILIAAKIADMGFGHPLQAILKLSAIAICTPAMDHLVAELTGTSFVGWGVSLVLYFALFIWLFELDMGEAQIVVGIVWVLNILASIFLMGVLFGVLGLS